MGILNKAKHGSSYTAGKPTERMSKQFNPFSPKYTYAQAESAMEFDYKAYLEKVSKTLLGFDSDEHFKVCRMCNTYNTSPSCQIPYFARRNSHGSLVNQFLIMYEGHVRSAIVQRSWREALSALSVLTQRMMEYEDKEIYSHFEGLYGGEGKWSDELDAEGNYQGKAGRKGIL